MTTNLLSVIEQLVPCPFCGAGTTEIKENGKMWAGMKYSDPVSVSVQHWCEPVNGQPSRMIERIGRDTDAAIAAWNQRAALAAGKQALEQTQGEASEVSATLAQFGKDGTKDWPEWMTAAAHTATASFPNRSKELREFDIRGVLAAKLTCWHRLTEAESNELVALFAAHPRATEPAPKRPPNCGTGHCSCIECVMEPAPSTAGEALVKRVLPERMDSTYFRGLGWNECIDAITAAQPAQGERAAMIRRLLEDHHTWRDSIERCCEAAALLSAPSLPAAAMPVGEQARPMDTAPTDGAMIRLLVDFEDNSLEDTDQPVWTVGACYASDSEGNVWQFAGWNWSHDCFTEGHGKPIGWLPMLAAASTQPVREPLTDDTKRIDALEASNVGQNMWIVARGKDSFTVALKSPYGNCVTRRTLREAIDAGIESAHGIGVQSQTKDQTP